MAVTHADLAPAPKSSNLGSKTGACLMVISILLGLFCFILCLIAEAARSHVKWAQSQCTYTGSGKLPLLSATAAFAALAAAMVVQHVFLLVAVSKSEPLQVDIADSALPKTLSCQAAFFFVATWATFAVAEIQLLIGVSVESGHLKNWAAPRPSCLGLRQGMFTAAGVLALATVFLAAGLYITALRAERYLQIQQNTQRHILEVSIMYASPPTSPVRNPTLQTAPAEGSNFQIQHQHLHYYLTTFDKQSRFV